MSAYTDTQATVRLGVNTSGGTIGGTVRFDNLVATVTRAP
jgi:hypothetical protein